MSLTACSSPARLSGSSHTDRTLHKKIANRNFLGLVAVTETRFLLPRSRRLLCSMGLFSSSSVHHNIYYVTPVEQTRGSRIHGNGYGDISRWVFSSVTLASLRPFISQSLMHPGIALFGPRGQPRATSSQVSYKPRGPRRLQG